MLQGAMWSRGPSGMYSVSVSEAMARKYPGHLKESKASTVINRLS
jgi:hypothetical protein